MEKGRDSKPHIGIYGRRNNGKSSLINCLTGQDIAIVSELAGTTTDPVKKSYEITDFGPVILIDTAGIDDIGDIGEKRISKTLSTIKTIDLALLIVAENIFDDFEIKLIEEFNKFDIPYIVIYNKVDLVKPTVEYLKQIEKITNKKTIEFSALNSNTDEILNQIRIAVPENAFKINPLFEGLVNQGDFVLLITPVDTEAPEGRIILPQMQAVRGVLDKFGICIVLKETEVEHFFNTTSIPIKLAVTDSQLFGKIDKIIPANIPLTGFSVLLAKNKGDFDEYMKGTPAISNLKDGDIVLILESCSHHVTCDDIGRFKIPNWLKKFTEKKLEFEVVSGLASFPRPIKEYSLVVQCGACMITNKQLKSRLQQFKELNIPVTNYGMAIAYTNGIYNRAIEPFNKLKG